MTVMQAGRQPARLAPAASAGRGGLVAHGGPLALELSRRGFIQWYVRVGDGGLELSLDNLDPSAVAAAVYVPVLTRLPDLEPDVERARSVFAACRRAGVSHVVLLSSAAVYGSTPHHAGLATEQRTPPPVGQPIARAWQSLEAEAIHAFGGSHTTILRAVPTLVPGSRDFFSELFAAPAAATVTGHDPTLQFLTTADVCRAIACALERRAPGTFNIVPAAPIPLGKALECAGVRRVPVPWTVHWALRAGLHRTAGVASARQMSFLRYHLTASGAKAARQLGFVPRETSADALRAVRAAAGRPALRQDVVGQFDPFGLDRHYIDRCWRGFMGLMHRHYWRIETHGLDHIPQEGAGILVGMHRGWMPFDGVMTLLSVVQGTRRVPRFLIHPGVGLRFPFLFNLMSKLGGVIASQENAAYVLAAGELLGVYPEGIRGAFTMYKDAHRIGPSWRNDCVAFALRHRAPIVPFVTIGSADIFPIVGRIDWKWWKKYAEWPFIPITTPLPLPSKWHTVFLEPLDVGRDHPPDAADDQRIVRAIGAEVRRRMEQVVADLTRRRRSIFFGSLFERGRP